MLPAAPIKVCPIPGVTVETPLISVASSQLARIHNVSATASLGTRLGVLLTVLVTLFALGGARVLQEFSAFAMQVERKGVHNGPVALQTVSANHGLLNRRAN